MSADRDDEQIIFAQVDADLDSHPKIRKAGSFGRQVFEFILRRNARRGFKGSVPISHVDADYLAEQLMIDPADAVTGVTKAVTAKLIELDERAGVVRIVGWHASWGKRAKEGKERTREWRERNRLKEQDPVTSGDDGDETPSQVTTGDESDAREEKRREEIGKSPPRAPAYRAIPPSTEYDPESPADRIRLARQTYERIATARVGLANEFGLPVVPMPPCNTPAEPIGFRDLKDRVRAEGAVAPQACEAVILNLLSQARDERSTEWLSEKAFTEGGWRFARNGSKPHRAGPQSARANPRGAIGSGTPRRDHGDDMKPAKEVM